MKKLITILFLLSGATLSASNSAYGNETSGETVQFYLPDPIYALFDTERGDMPAVVVVNAALLNFEQKEVFGWHLYIRILSNTSNKQGMPAIKEGAILFEIGDRIEEALSKTLAERDATNVLFVARSTWNNQRELHYYVHDPERANKVLQSLVNDPSQSHDWEFEMRQDQTWDEVAVFFDLFSKIK